MVGASYFHFLGVGAEKSCYALLGKIGLKGEIHSISRGRGYLTCGSKIEKIIFINNSSKVVICDPYSFL